MLNPKKETSGDVLRINIVPPGHTPWVKITLHKHGIRYSGEKREAGGVDIPKSKSRKKAALEIGEEIIRNSKVLKAWFEQS